MLLKLIWQTWMGRDYIGAERERLVNKVTFSKQEYETLGGREVLLTCTLFQSNQHITE